MRSHDNIIIVLFMDTADQRGIAAKRAFRECKSITNTKDKKNYKYINSPLVYFPV